MDPIKISFTLKTSSMEEINDFSLKFGWDIRYSQLGCGIFEGEYQEGTSQSLTVTRESLSVPVSIKGGAIPGCVALGMYVSTDPAKLNGQDLQPNHLMIIKPGAEFDFVTRGPGEILFTLFPESRFEGIPGDSFGTIKNSIENARVFSKETNGGAGLFKNWFQNWPSHLLWQTEIGSKALTHQLDEIVYSSLGDIAENLEGKAGEKGTRLKRSKKQINRLIDYFHCYPDQLFSIEDMCKITSLSRRNLFYNFKEYSGLSPQDFFRFIRLGFLHSDLLKSYQNITNLAIKYNFLHLGEFSALYKNTFGELPSETQKKISGARS